MTQRKSIRIRCAYSVDLVPWNRLALVGALVVLTGCREQPAPTLDVATTTSVQNSGLLEALLPHFTDATVRVYAAGSGRALEMLKDGIVDLVISQRRRLKRATSPSIRIGAIR